MSEAVLAKIIAIPIYPIITIAPAKKDYSKVTGAISPPKIRMRIE